MNELLITRYVSSWGWHILATIFFCSAFVILSLRYEMMSIIFPAIFILVFFIMEITAYKRKSKLYEGEDV